MKETKEQLETRLRSCEYYIEEGDGIIQQQAYEEKDKIIKILKKLDNLNKKS